MKPGGRRTLWMALVGLAAILIAAWWGTRVGALPAPTVPNLASGPQPRAIELDVPSSSEGTAMDPSLGSRSGAHGISTTSVARAASGTLVVRVVDDATDVPVAEIPLRVGRERGGDRLLATGTSDARGEARFENVEANTVIVEASRSPQHARAFAAVWLVPGQTHDVVLRLVAGCTVRGRVVDDLGAALSGAEILTDDAFTPRFTDRSAARKESMPAAVSGADGLFEIAHLAAVPREVWIEHGVLSPRRWDPPRLRLTYEDARVFVDTRIEATDAAVDIGDVVVPRARTISGIVLGAHGDAVAGALVTTRVDRMDVRERGLGAWLAEAEGSPRFGEAISDAGGQFELRARPFIPWIAVRTSAGREERFALPEGTPGDRLDGLELRLADESLLAIELVDRRGRRIDGSPAEWRGGFRSGGNLRRQDRLRVSISAPKLDLTQEIGADSDGTFRVQLPAELRGPVALQLDLSGYAPVLIDTVTLGSDALRVQLDDLPLLRLRVRIDDESWPDPEAVGRIELHACVRDPGLSRTDEDLPAVFASCCGLGFVRSFPAVPGASDLDFPVQVDQPFYVEARRRPGRWTRTFGPFRPGAEVHEIAIPAAEPRDAVSPRQDQRAKVRVRLTDAHTGERLAGMMLLEDPARARGDPMSRGTQVVVAEPGSDAWREVCAGTWRATIQVEEYEPLAAIEVVLVPDAEHDLGSFALERLPIVELVAFEADGVPSAGEMQVALADARGGYLTTVQRPSGDAPWRVSAKLGTSGSATVSAWSKPLGARSQTLSFDYDGSGKLVLHLLPWRRLEVECKLATALQLACALHVDVSDAGSAAKGKQEGSWLEERVATPTVRRFTGTLAAGDYVVRTHSLLFGDVTANVTIPAGAGGPVRIQINP